MKNYSGLKLYGKTEGDEWFVGFTFFCEKRDKKKRCQVRLGINYQPTIRGRIIEGENVRKIVESCLNEGWNPFDCDLKTFVKLQEAPSREVGNPRYLPFNEAMQWAFDK